MSTATTPLARPRASRKLSKHLLWYAFGLAGISVLYYTDYPIVIHPHDPYTQKLIFDRFLLIPHAIAGILATALGPFQFSTRFRQRHLPLHRLMGKTYVICIAVAAPMALILGQRGYTFPMKFVGVVQPVLWFLCTAVAFITARNRHITVHRPVDDPLLRLHPQLHLLPLPQLHPRLQQHVRGRHGYDSLASRRPLLLHPRHRLQLARTHHPPRLTLT